MRTVSRKTTKTCAITLTKDIRHDIGIMPGSVVDITVNDDQTVTLKKHTASCFCCGSVENVKVFKGYEICESCRKELVENV
ncbi:MAG: AbrB/MazE/SpoVT family DNA-binding domain-containing protein [Clostridia bacterium]|nr:AbrB/MazE/SpoVT family DNA-binding domain-containing protein [Clostridia bacterium]